jgi:hypothetical protein
MSYRITKAAAISSLALFMLSISFISFAYAQIDLSGNLAGEDSDLTIAMAPNAPSPGDIVDLSVESSLLDTTDSTIRWYDNGTIVAQGIGVTSATITAGGLGSVSTIVVALVTADGTSASTEISIVPTEVDLLIDSDSYVPPFYLGRALPSAGTDLRLQAIAHLKRPNGTLVPSSDITYTWKQDGRVVGNVSGLGKASVVLPSPTLYGTSDIEVDVESSDDTLSGSASLSIPAQTPAVLLYEDNPLLGLTYYHAMTSQTSIPDIEMTFAAVPYFAPIQSPNDPRLAYAWTVNGKSVASSANDPSELTLNATNSSGQATIGLGLTHSTDIFMSAQGSWGVAFGVSSAGQSSGGSKNPFSGQNE